MLVRGERRSREVHATQSFAARVHLVSLDRDRGFISARLCVWLVVRRNISNFPVGIANNAFFIVLFIQAGSTPTQGCRSSTSCSARSAGTGGCTGVSDSEAEVRPTPLAAWAGAAVGNGSGTWLLNWLLGTTRTPQSPGGDALTDDDEPGGADHVQPQVDRQLVRVDRRRRHLRRPLCREGPLAHKRPLCRVPGNVPNRACVSGGRSSSGSSPSRGSPEAVRV